MFFGPGTWIPSHRHSKDVVTLVLEGHLEMTVGSETRNVGPGGVFWFQRIRTILAVCLGTGERSHTPFPGLKVIC